jgi:Skp family chaperone for outer membrane proteins
VAALAGLFLVCLFACYTALGQQPGRMSVQPPGGIAFLDVPKLFKSHGRFNEMMAELKGDESKAETAMKGEVDYVTNMMEGLKQFKPGTEEFSRQEQEIARRRADMNVRIQLQRKEFLVREAKIYNQVYQEVAKAVEEFAVPNGISMVVRVSGDQVDPNDPQAVLQNINRQVIFFNRNMDITGAILDRLNRDRPSMQDPRNAVRPAVGVPGPGIR